MFNINRSRLDLVPELSFLGYAIDAAAPFSFNHSFGAAQASRRIIAVIHSLGFFGLTLTSVTIGGVSATIHVSNTHEFAALRPGAAIASALVPSGTSGLIVPTFSGSTSGAECAVAVYRAINLRSGTPIDTAQDDGDVVNMSIEAPEGGILVAGGAFLDTGAIASSGLTEDYEDLLDAQYQFAGGSASALAEQASRAISFNGPSGQAAGVVASFR